MVKYSRLYMEKIYSINKGIYLQKRKQLIIFVKYMESELQES
jgi:hypothetical protein